MVWLHGGLVHAYDELSFSKDSEVHHRKPLRNY
jgi:hypothetical protein